MPPLLGVVRDRGRFVLPVVFLLLMPMCVVVAALMPTGEQPDEIAHAVRADSLLHGELLGHRFPRPDKRMKFDAGVTANPALVTSGFTFPAEPLALKKLTPAIADRAGAVPWADKLGFVESPNSAVYFPLFYVPAAFGIGLAHLAGVGPHAAIIGGRMADVAAYLVLGLCALLLAERAQLAIFTALALPMSLFAAASVCPDGALIATAALSVAALTRTGPERSWARPLAGIGIAAVIATKAPYFPLALCAFAPLPLRGWTWRQAARSAVEALVVVLPGLAWTAVSIVLVSVPFVKGPPYHPGPLWPGDPAVLFQTTDMAAQLAVLVHRPGLIATLPVRAMIAGWDNYLRSMIGVLGLLNIVLPDWSYHVWEWALAAAAAAELLRSRAEPRSVRGGGALVIGLAIVASVFATFMAQYLSWTSVGAAMIDGVQGRYFLPLIPFAALVVPPLGLRAFPVRWLLAAPAVVAATAGIDMLPRLVVTTFYLR